MLHHMFLDNTQTLFNCGIAFFDPEQELLNILKRHAGCFKAGQYIQPGQIFIVKNADTSITSLL